MTSTAWLSSETFAIPCIPSLRRIRTKPRYSPTIPGFSSDAAQAIVYLEHLDSINKNPSEQDRARTVKDFFSRDSLIYFFGYLYIYYF